MARSRESLLDEISLREASLRDAENEHAAGELSASELDAIATRENSAISELRVALASLSDIPELVAPRRRRRWQLVVALVCFASAAGVLLVSTLTTRQPGDSATGSISASDQTMVRRLLAEGEVDIATGRIAAALAAYDAVLMIDPNNVTALTQSGWFYFSAGSDQQRADYVTKGTERLRRAVSHDPRNPSAQLYYAIAALSTPGNESLARRHMRAFLQLSPSTALLTVAAPYRTQLGL